MVLREELIFGRPSMSAKVFVSSEMRSGELAAERLAAAEAIAETGFHHSWTWENDGYASEFCAKGLCIGNAETSDYLILILGRKLTPVTREEYFAAKVNLVPTIVFARTGCTRTRAAQKFVDEEASNSSYGEFGSSADLKRRIVESLKSHFARTLRERQYQRRVSLGGVRGALDEGES